MKRSIATTLAFLGLSFLLNAQDKLDVNVYDDLCVDAVTVVFTDGFEEEYTLGCEGTYSFDFKGRTIQYLEYYGVISTIGTTTTVSTPKKKFTSNTKVVNVGNTIVDDLNGLIR